MQQPHQTLTPIPDAAHQETTVATTEAKGGGATLDAALRVASRQSRKADATATEADTIAESASDPRDLRSQRGSACDDSGGDAIVAFAQSVADNFFDNAEIIYVARNPSEHTRAQKPINSSMVSE